MASAKPWNEPEISRNLDAERAVLGCVLIEPAILSKLMPQLHASDFSLAQHRIIYESMCNIARQGDAPDELMLCDWMKTHDRLEASGGVSYVCSLSTVVPGSFDVSQWARIVLEHSARRAQYDLGCAYVQASQRKDAEPAAEIAKQRARLESILCRIEGNGNASPEDKPLGIPLSEITVEDFHWLWHGRVALGKLTVADGDPGLGKSLATLDLAARVAMGNAMPDGSLGLNAPAGVVLICGEDGLADTVTPRLLAAGASPEAMARIRAVNLVPELRPDGTTSERLISLLIDLPALEETITTQGVRLLVIDPVTAYLGSGTDMYKDADLRRVLTPLALMAERAGVAVILVRHLNKSNNTPALHRGLGGVGVIGVARLGLLFAPNPDVEGEILVSRHKGNIGAPPPTLAYRIGQVGEAENMPCISWLGERETTAEVALAAQAGADISETRSATDEAMNWLQAYLADGPRPAKEIQDAARADGIIGRSDKPLRKARERLGVETYREGGIASEGRWMWSYIDPSSSEGHIRHNATSQQTTKSQSSGPPAKVPIPSSDRHLSTVKRSKSPSEDGEGQLSVVPVFNALDAASDGLGSSKVPSPPAIVQMRANAQSICPQCGSGDLWDYGDGARCKVCDVLVMHPSRSVGCSTVAE